MSETKLNLDVDNDGIVDDFLLHEIIDEDVKNSEGEPEFKPESFGEDFSEIIESSKSDGKKSALNSSYLVPVEINDDYDDVLKMGKNLGHTKRYLDKRANSLKQKKNRLDFLQQQKFNQVDKSTLRDLSNEILDEIDLLEDIFLQLGLEDPFEDLDK